MGSALEPAWGMPYSLHKNLSVCVWVNRSKTLRQDPEKVLRRNRPEVHAFRNLPCPFLLLRRQPKVFLQENNCLILIENTIRVGNVRKSFQHFRSFPQV